MIRTVSNTNHLDLERGAILVTHGDILFLDLAPWSRDAKHYRLKHREILEVLGPDVIPISKSGFWPRNGRRLNCR